MGTRAQFFIGNPSNLSSREWLGCVAFDGYPDGDVGEALGGAETEAEFRAAIARISTWRDDFCDPSKRGFPFPWVRDLYLTDWTYAFFDGAVQASHFHSGFYPLCRFLSDEGTPDDETLPRDVPAPTATWDASGPDSIIVVSCA